ncbi:MAG: hypothetical protein AAFY71_28415 [Bacteroidota bacterium]
MTVGFGQENQARWVREELGDESLNAHIHVEKVRMEITHPADFLFNWPSFKDSLGGFEIIKTGTIDTLASKGSSLTRGQEFLLMATGEGQLSLPDIVVKGVLSDGEQDITLGQTFIDIATTEVDTSAVFKPIKEIVSIPKSLNEQLFAFGLALLIMVLLALGIWYYRRWKEGKQITFTPPPPQIPDHEIAMGALAKLEEKKLWQQGQIKEYYSELTDIVRSYIESRYRIPAMESVSDEILKDLKGENLKAPMLRGLHELFNRSDLAKFAKSQPETGENLGAMDFARTFVKESKELIPSWEKEKMMQEEEARKEEAEV